MIVPWYTLLLAPMRVPRIMEVYDIISQPSPISTSASINAKGCMVTLSPSLAVGSTWASGLMLLAMMKLFKV